MGSFGAVSGRRFGRDRRFMGLISHRPISGARNFVNLTGNAQPALVSMAVQMSACGSWLRRTNFPEAVTGQFSAGDDRALFRVMKDNSNRVPHSGPHVANAVTKVHAVGSLRSPHWPMMDCKGYSITLLK